MDNYELFTLYWIISPHACVPSSPQMIRRWTSPPDTRLLWYIYWHLPYKWTKCRLNIRIHWVSGALFLKHPWSCFSSKDLGTWPHRLCQLAGLMKQHHQDISKTRNSKAFASQQKTAPGGPREVMKQQGLQLTGIGEHYPLFAYDFL